MTKAELEKIKNHIDSIPTIAPLYVPELIAGLEQVLADAANECIRCDATFSDYCAVCLDALEKERDEARAEVVRLSAVVRQVHALSVTEERDYRCVRVVEQLRGIHEITKGMVE